MKIKDKKKLKLALSCLDEALDLIHENIKLEDNELNGPYDLYALTNDIIFELQDLLKK